MHVLIQTVPSVSTLTVTTTLLLLSGLVTNLTLTDELIPLRKAFAHVGLATRLLADTPAGKSMDINVCVCIHPPLMSPGAQV